MNDTEEFQGGNTPPYLSPTTFYNFIEAHRRTLPTRIDRSIMGNVAGGDQIRILRALQFFGLIDDDGHPTAEFQRLANLDGRDLQHAWITLLKYGYPYLFEGFNLEKATQSQIEERFREKGIKGDTVRKAVAFFIGLARQAEIGLSPYFKGVKKRGPSGPRSPRKNPVRRAARGSGGVGDDAGGGADALSDRVIPSKLPAVIQAWIDEMPPAGDPWAREDFDSWLALFAGSIERLYKIPK